MRQSIFGAIERCAAGNPAAPALLAPGRQPLSYGRLLSEIDAIAATLTALGVETQDRVALHLNNGPEAALGFLAVAAVASCAPINPSCRAAEFDATLRDLSPKALLASPDLDAAKRTVAEKHGITVIEATPALECEAGAFTLTSARTARLRRFRGVPAEASDIALLLHTSGTTARPKLVGLTHENLCRSAAHVSQVLQLGPVDRCLNIMPLFHIHGIVAGILASLHAGASVVCSPGLQARHFFQWMAEFQPSWYTAVPTMHATILAHAPQHRHVLKRSSLRFIRSCSAALPAPVMREMERQFEVPVVEAYGMTEAAHQIASNPLPPAIRKPGSVGIATGTEIAIVDEQGRALGPDVEGDIVVRGGSVIAGYIDNPSANEHNFTSGWFRTGDIGSIDRDGYLFIKGRVKEIINRGGTKISPHEVEQVVLQHPAVAEAVAFAMPDTRLGEEVAVAIVPRSPDRVTPTELRDFASLQLGDLKLPRRIVFVDEIPKGPTGKPQRLGLAGRLGLLDECSMDTHQTGAPVREPRTRLESLLAAMWPRIVGRDDIGLRDNFFEIGGDSLVALELITAVAQVTGRQLSIAALFEAPTIEQFAALIERDDPGRLPHVVPIQAKGSRPPFFCVGAGPLFLKLANYLGSDQPFLGLADPGGRPASSLEEIAEFHVRSIRAVQPEGPYCIGGWCVYGLVAYEIAQQLQAKGQRVALLALFDTCNPGGRDAHSLLETMFARCDAFGRKMWFHLRSLARLKLREVPSYCLERLETVRLDLKSQVWLLLSRASAKLGSSVSLRDLDEIYRIAGMQYRPKPYHGRVVVFRRSVQRIGGYQDERLGWGDVLTGDCDVIAIPGDHRDMFLEPQVQRTAGALAAYLRSVAGENTLRTAA